MKKYVDTALGQTAAGATSPLVGGSVTIRVHVGQALATIYSDDGVTTTANPVTTDINGRYQFYIANGRYDLIIAGPGFTTVTLSDIDIHDETDITVPGETPLAGNLIFTGANSHSGIETFSGTVKHSSAVLLGAGPIFDVTAPPFSADPTGIADSTTAIQSAITAAAGRWIYVPAGTYKTSAQLIYNLQSASAFEPGLKMYGDGKYASIIKPTSALANTCALYLNGTESGNTFFFQYGATLRDLTFDGSASGTNACGIKIEGNWFASLEHVRIANFTGDGILFPSRADISSNPDAYGSNFARIINCDINSNGGWGINQQDGPEGDHSIENNNIVKNVLGGIRLNGEETRVIGNAIAFSGFHQAGSSQAVGVLLDKGPNAIGGCDTCVLEDNEFDSSFMADIMVPRSIGMRIGQNRFLSHYNTVSLDNLVHPLTHIFLNGDVDSVSSFDILANRHLSATRAAGNSAFNASITAHLIRGSNVSGGNLNHPFVLSGNSPNIVKYASSGGGLISVITSGGVVQNTAQVLNPGFYTSAPTITFDATAGSGASATATLGTVPWYIEVTNPGSGYTSAPLVTFNGGTCSTTPTASAIITPSTNSNSIVSEVRITTYGNCSVAPTSISFSGGGGSGAAATGFYSTGIVSINISSGGSGYPTTVGVVVTPVSTEQTFSVNSFIDLFDRNNSNQDFIGNNLLMMQIKTLGFCNGGIPCVLDRGFTSDGAATTIDVGNGSFRDTSGSLKATAYLNPSGLPAPFVIASSTATMGTGAIAATSCAAAVTTTATGVATTDAIIWAFNAAPPSGYAGASPAAGLQILAYVTSGNVNFQVCNPTAASITPTAATLNWRVVR